MNPALATILGAAVGQRLARRRRVIVGRDSRSSGELLAQSVINGLRGVGCEVIDLGIVPTPTVPLMVSRRRAAAGIQISASHNPEPWNAFKIYNRHGRNVDAAQLAQVVAGVRNPAAQWWQAWDHLGAVSSCSTAIDEHLSAVCAAVDRDVIRARQFTVVMDSVNGAGAVIAPRLLEALGCRVIPLYDRVDRPFPRNPEPTSANVVETGAVVKAVGADIGFVQDPDADRLAVIDGQGRYIGEEYTLVLCAAARFAAVGGQRALAVTNLSTSRMLEDVAASYGARVLRTAVGEANVLDAMEREGALIGGEGNGGVIDPRVVSCRDSQVAMALILEYLARTQKSLAEVLAAIPQYAMHKEKVALSREQVQAALGGVRDAELARGAEINEVDGLKLSWPDRWLHLRASGTEPVSRIISEAPTAREARTLAAALRRHLGAQVVSGH